MISEKIREGERLLNGNSSKIKVFLIYTKTTKLLTVKRKTVTTYEYTAEKNNTKSCLQKQNLCTQKKIVLLFKILKKKFQTLIIFKLSLCFM